MKHYTSKQAEKEIGKSKSYALALKVSIKKWEEIVKHGKRYYKALHSCGYCLVRLNRVEGNVCIGCPVKEGACRIAVLEGFTKSGAKKVLRKLKKRRKK